MYKLKEGENTFLEENYNHFLVEIKKLMLFLNRKDLIEIFYCLSCLFHSGYFSENKRLYRDTTFSYVSIFNMNDAYQALTGISACRHSNKLLKDILSFLLIPSQDFICMIKENNEESKQLLNHKAVLSFWKNKTYALDLFNELLFYPASNYNLQGIKNEYCLKLGDIPGSIKIVQEYYKKYGNNHFESIDLDIETITNENLKILRKNKKELEEFYQAIKIYLLNIKELIEQYEMYRKLGVKHPL